MGTSHPLSLGSNNHSITSNPNSTGAPYADIAARDADTDFQITTNIDKVVRVESPSIDYFSLISVGPTVWSTGLIGGADTLAEVLALGNTSGGSDLIISAGDVITINDAPAIGTDGANKQYVDDQILTQDTFLELTDTPSSYSGEAFKVPRVNAGETALEFSSAGVGDVVGTVPSTDNALPRYDGASGLLIQDSVVIVSDTGLMSGVLDPVSAQDAATMNYVDTQDTALDFYTADGLLTSTRQVQADGSSIFLLFQISDPNEATFLTQSDLFISHNSIVMGVSVGLGGGAINSQSTISINTAEMVVRDSTHEKGLVYALNYSANFTNESLVSKRYVDALTFGSSVGELIFNNAGALDGAAQLFYDVGNGRLGIGTVAPTQLLHVSSTGDAVVVIEADTDNVGEDDNPTLQLIQDGGAIRGNFGLNGTAGFRYTNALENAAFLEAKGSATTAFQLVTGATSEFAANGVARLTALMDGKIGIGTNAPTEVLHVVGNILASGTIQGGPANVIVIASQADWDAQVSGGLIDITVDTTFDLRTTITWDTDTVTLQANSGANFSIIGNRISTVGLLVTGTGTLLTSTSSGFLRIDGINNIDGNATAKFLDLDNSAVFVEISNSGVFNWADLGSVTNSSQFRILSVGFFNIGAGFALDNVGTTFVSGPVLANAADMADAYIKIESTRLNDISVILDGIEITMQPTESLVQIDPAIGDGSTVVVTNNLMSGSNKTLFDISGSTGTFTAVADASVGATTINSVTDSSGVARFNFTVGPTLFVNQSVVISAFVTNTAYNGTFAITATGTGFFEVSSIPFGTDETGSFLSDSVTLTDTTTTLSDGDTLVIDTDLSTDYDGGAVVYNQLTNSFRINRPFTVTKTGEWDTSGLDQIDPRVLAFLNPGVVDSKYIACAHVNDNSTANGAIVNNTFTDIVFGTVGDALIESSTSERWKLIDEINGTFEYMGVEPFDDAIQFDFTVLSSGGTVDFRFKWQHDIGAGFVDLPDNVESLVAVSSSAQSVTKKFPLIVAKGDLIKPLITRNSGTSGITTTYATIFAGG